MVESLVSIIVPCFNGEPFLDRCLGSIFIQEYNDIETIVVDDGSTDCSREKVIVWEERFRKLRRKLIYLHQENSGPSGAVNAGLKCVNGEYLTLLDVDDEYLPGCIEEKVQFLKQHEEIDVVRSNGYVIKGENKYLFMQHDEIPPENVFMALLGGGYL